MTSYPVAIENIEQVVLHGGYVSLDNIIYICNNFERADSKYLRKMLRSKSYEVVEVAIRIFCNLGSISRDFIRDILPVISKIDDDDSVFRALGAINDVYFDFSVEDVALWLGLAHSAKPGIRWQVSWLLATVSIDRVLKAATHLSDVATRAIHMSSLRFIRDPLPLNEIVDAVVSPNNLEACYAAAGLIRLNPNDHQIAAYRDKLRGTQFGSMWASLFPIRRPSVVY